MMESDRQAIDRLCVNSFDDCELFSLYNTKVRRWVLDLEAQHSLRIKKQIGYGCFARTFSLENMPHLVLKITGCHVTSAFLQEFADHPNPHFMRNVRYLGGLDIMGSTSRLSAFVMESLTPVAWQYGAAKADIRRRKAYASLSDHLSFVRLSEFRTILNEGWLQKSCVPTRMLSALKDLHTFLADYSKQTDISVGIDLHEENFMCRGNTLVIVDPAVDRDMV